MIGILASFAFGLILAMAPDASACGGQKDKTAKKDIPAKYIGQEVTCPVSGERLVVDKDTKFSVYKSQYYFFTCNGSKTAFDENPEKYATSMSTNKEHKEKSKTKTSKKTT